jgi:valyl-tRNA synthetase
MNNIRPWPISRQLWWGHRIPVWICKDCDKYTVTREDPTECSHCKSENIYQETDVLDTWFSSWLWPFSTLGWPDKTKDLDYFYPTDVLSTAPEILFFWVARMIMAGLYALDKIPFKRVYFHSTVLDEIGRKQSKSLNNSLDPLEVIKYFGADALRFTILSLAPIGQNIKVGLDTKSDETIKKSKFSEIGSKFCNKLWNASRFFLLNLDEKYVSTIKNVNLDEIDRWILSELNETIKIVNKSLDSFRFNDVANTLYHFVWDNYCDWYLELSKVRLYGEEEEAKKTATTVLLHVLEQTLKLLHPLMPFITEEIYQKLPNHDESIMISKYPEFDPNLLDKEAEKDFELIQEMVYNIRNIRGEARIPIEKKINVIFKTENEKSEKILSKFSDYIKPLAKVSELSFGSDKKRPEKSAYAVGNGYEIYIPLSGILDIDKEKQRILKEISKAENELKRVNNKLSNDKFINNAPAEVVDKEKNKQEEYQNSIEKLKHNLDLIS